MVSERYRSTDKVGIVDGEGINKEAHVDIGGGLTNIEEDHHMIHHEHMFYASYVDSIMVDTDVIEVLLVAPNTDIRCHVIAGCGSTAEATFEFYESTTLTGGGVALTAFNKDRNSKATKPSLVATHSPTVVSAGILLQTRYLGATGRTSITGGDLRGVNEWILKKNTNYLLRLTAHGNLKGRLYANWYEI